MSKVEQLSRLGKQNLFIGQAVGEVGKDGRGIDLMRVPQLAKGARILTPFRRSNFGVPYYEHIYGCRESDPLLSIHLRLNTKTTGTFNTSDAVRDLDLAASSVRNESYEDNDFSRRINEIRTDYINADEMKRDEVAEELSRVVSGREVYMCARDTRDDYRDPGLLFYVAKVNGIANLRKGSGMRFEPVVATPSGEGLLPEHMYLFQGIYVPTSLQDLRLLHRAGDCANV